MRQLPELFAFISVFFLLLLIGLAVGPLGAMEQAAKESDEINPPLISASTQRIVCRMSNERTIDGNFARIVVYHNDPRDLEDVTSNRHFDVEIYHRAGTTDIDQGVDRVQFYGTIDELIGLLRTLEVNGVEVRARVDARGRMIIDCVPFDPEEAVELLRHDPSPLRCYLEPIMRNEVEEKLELWKRRILGRLPVRWDNPASSS